MQLWGGAGGAHGGRSDLSRNAIIFPCQECPGHAALAASGCAVARPVRAVSAARVRTTANGGAQAAVENPWLERWCM